MSGNITSIHPFLDEKYFFQYAGISQNRCAELCNVHPKTVKKWIRNNTWPVWARRLIMLHGGFLSAPGWENWQLHGADNKLYSPNIKDGFTPSDIESIYFLRQRCDRLEQINQAPAQYYLDL